MWTLSISHATKHDAAMIDRWKSDMDGILVYVRSEMAPRLFVTPFTFLTKLSRRVYSPRRLLRFSSKATSTSSLMQLTYPKRFSNKSRRNLLGSPTENGSPLQLLKHFSLNAILFVLTFFGSSVFASVSGPASALLWCNSGFAGTSDSPSIQMRQYVASEFVRSFSREFRISM